MQTINKGKMIYYQLQIKQQKNMNMNINRVNSIKKEHEANFFLRRFIIFSILFILETISAGVAPTILSHNHFGSGSVTIISTTKSNTFNQNFTITFSPALPAPTSYYNIIIGVTQFVIPKVNRIEFNFSKYSLTTTAFILNCKLGNQTVLSQLGINYMVVDNSITDHQLLMYDYKCTVLNQSTGYRSEKITYTTTKLSNSNDTALKANIVLQSFNVSNFDGYFYTFYHNIVQKNHTFTVQLITTNFNLFQSIQFWLMVIDSSQMNIYQTYYQDLQSYLFNSGSGISTYIPSINNSLYLNTNRYFFGVSQFNFSTYMISTLKLDTSNPSNLAQNYLFTNIDFIYMFAYFRAKRVCPASQYYNVGTGLCDTTCSAPYSFIDSVSMLCQACYYSCAANSCNSPLQNECFSCYDSSRQQLLTSTSPNKYSCPCATGYFQSGIASCYNCGNYIPGCTSCSDSLTCTSCNSANNLILNGTSCKCSDHTKVQIDSLCYNLIGCTAITMSGSTALCTQCSWAKGFVFDATYVCVCQSYKSIVQVSSGDYYCLYTCGDGYVSPDEECDDGNSNSGDGCFDCKVQTNFTCTGVLNITSVCLYNVQIILNYIGTTRQIYLNKAELYFSLQPRDMNIKSINNFNLSALIVTSIPYFKLQANLLDIQSQTALSKAYYLQVIIEYNESIQNQPHDLYLNLTNYWQWMHDSTTSIFVASGSNAQISLKSDSDLTMYSKIEYVVLTFVGIAYILAFVSLFFDRLIGIQLMVTVQTIYYLLSAVQQNPVQLVPLQRALIYSTGFNKITYFINSDYPQYLRTYFLPSNFHHQALEKQFIMNFNISFAIFLLTLFIIFIFYLANKCRKIQYQTNQDLFRIQLGNQNRQICCSLQSIYECLFNRILLMVSFWILPQIIFAICIQTNQYEPDFYLFQDSINVLSSFISFLLLVCLILGLAYWYMKQSVQQVLEAKKGIIDQNKNLLPLSFKICKMEYPLIYLIYQFVKFMLIALFLEYAVSLDIILCLQIGYFIFLVIYRPYSRINPNLQGDQDQEDLNNECFSIHNFTIAFNELILICICFLIIVWNQMLDNYNFTTQYPSIITYLVIIFLLCLNILALLRLFYKKLGKLICCDFLKQGLFKGEGEDQFQFQHMRKLLTKNDLDKLKKQQDEQLNQKDDEDELSKTDKKTILKDLKKNKTNFMNWPQFSSQNGQENQDQNYSKFPNKVNTQNKINPSLNNGKTLIGKAKILEDNTQRDISLLVSNPDIIDQSIDLLNKSNKKIFKGLNWVKQSQIQPPLNSKSSTKVKEKQSSSQSVLQNYLQSKTSSQPTPYVTDFVIRKSSNKKQAQLKKTGLQVLIQQKMAEANRSQLDPIKQQNDDVINLEEVKERLKQELEQKNNKKKQLKPNKQRKQSKQAKQLKQIKKVSGTSNEENEYKYMISSNEGEQKVNLLEKNKGNISKNKNKKDQSEQEQNFNKKTDPMKFFAFGMDDGI